MKRVLLSILILTTGGFLPSVVGAAEDPGCTQDALGGELCSPSPSRPPCLAYAELAERQVLTGDAICNWDYENRELCTAQVKLTEVARYRYGCRSYNEE